MEHSFNGNLPFSLLDNMTLAETVQPVAVRQYHPRLRLRHMFREAIMYCREKLKYIPSIETGNIGCFLGPDIKRFCLTFR